MELLNQPLYQRINDFEIGSNHDQLSFVVRLSRENGWNRHYSNRCLIEYKKFIYLATTGSVPVTPSDQVDQAWHLHLTYTRSYWNELCKNTLGKALHHDPTKGGSQESVKFEDLYAATLDRYRILFGEPPADIWPSAEERFRKPGRFRRLDISNFWLLRKPSKWLMALVPAPLILSACSEVQNYDSLFNLVLLVIAVLFFAVMIIGAIANHVYGKGSGTGNRGEGGGGTACSSGHGSDSSGCSGGGCGGCGGG